MVDSRNIEDLHPIVKELAGELIQRMTAQGYPVLVTSTYRDYEMQNTLYAQGRTTPGSIITNAKAGFSAHNHKVAFDICKNVKGHEFDDAKFFDIAGKVGGELGLEWGGSWTSFADRPHFQVLFGYSCSDLAGGVPVPQVIKSGCKDKRLVMFVQKLLGIEADGSFGSQTKAAAQKYNAAGEIDAATLRVLLHPPVVKPPVAKPSDTALDIIDAKYNLLGERDVAVPSIVVDGTTYSSARVLLEEMGYTVSWNSATATRVISKNR